MPAKAPIISIECTSLPRLLDELTSIQDAISRTETEETWETIGRALSRFAALCNGNASTYPTDLAAALRASSRPINSALNSERTRLSGTATDFIKTAVNALGSAFEPLIPQYLPTLLILCTRANKVFVTRAKECIHAVIEHTQSPSILHYLAESVKDKSVSLRLASAEAVVLCLNQFNPPDLEKEPRAKEIEAIIKATAVDANADVRKVARKVFDAYKILLPRRVQSFTDPLSPTIRKYLDIKSAAAVFSQPPSRPTSSQSVRSAHSDNHIPSHTVPSRPQPSTQSTATTAARASKHTRTVSTSSTAARRPARTPTPELCAPAPIPVHEPHRRLREETKRVAKLDMPPPDYIPLHTGRPLSATDLYFPHHAPPPERVAPGLQRIAPVDLVGPGATSTVRSGPIRPVMKPAGDPAEKRDRVVGGARRVLRLPETEAPHPAAEEGQKPAGTTSGPIRPRVISTSRSTPAVPLHTASAAAREREDALKAKRLASSQGAGAAGVSMKSTSGAVVAVAAAAMAAPRHARVPSGGVQSSTASARARAAEKAQEKAKEKEKAPAVTRKPSSRAVPSSKPAVPLRAGSAGPAAVTVRERTRTVSSSNAKVGLPAAHAKPVAKDDRTANAAPAVKSRAGTHEPPSRAQSVAPAEVPLPESPVIDLAEVASEQEDPIVETVAAPAQEQPSSSCVEEKQITPVPIPEPTSEPEAEQHSEQPLIDFDTSLPTPIPANIPLPNSTPASPPVERPTSPSVATLAESAAIPSSSSYPPLAPVQAASVSPPMETLPMALLAEPAQQEARTPEQRRAAHPAVEQTPISALVASIERGFFAMRGAPLSPTREEEEGEGESMFVEHDQICTRQRRGDVDPDARVFDDAVVERLDVGVPVRAVAPLFARRGRQVLHA